MISDKELVGHIWCWYTGNTRSSWNFYAGLLQQNLNIEIPAQELKKRFQRYFKEITGIKPYTKCPLCQKELSPQKSRYGYFVNCSTFPKCRFIASPEKPWTNKKEQNP